MEHQYSFGIKYCFRLANTYSGSNSFLYHVIISHPHNDKAMVVLLKPQKSIIVCNDETCILSKDELSFAYCEHYVDYVKTFEISLTDLKKLYKNQELVNYKDKIFHESGEISDSCLKKIQDGAISAKDKIKSGLHYLFNHF